MNEQDHEAMTASEPGTGWNRRRVLQGTAAVWAAPAIVAVTSAPVFAASGGVLTVSGGTTAVQSDGGQFYDVNCAGVTITPSTAVAAGTLTLSLSFAPTTANSSLYIYNYGSAPAGWVNPSPGGPSSSNGPLLFTYSGAIAAGAPVSFNGIHVGTNRPITVGAGHGTFTFTFAAPGKTSGAFSVATPPFARGTGDQGAAGPASKA